MRKVGKAKKVTMQQIADHVGVSKYAVSKALSGKTGISSTTRDRIFQTAARLGYFDQKSKGKKTVQRDDDDKLVGILIPDIRNQNKESYYWGEILDGISKQLEQKGIGSVIITDNSPESFRKIINPEGLLGVIGVGEIATSLLLELQNLSIPFVLVDHEDDLVPSDHIFMNNFDSTRKMTNYLLSLGHRDIQFIGEIGFSRSFYDRWTGFKMAMEENEIPYTPHKDLLHLQYAGEEEMIECLKRHLRNLRKRSAFPTAFVCANDHIVKLTLQALSDLGMEVPGDCSLAGFDNTVDFLHHQPGITTVNAEREALGSRAVDTLLWRLDNREMPFEKILLRGNLVLRDTTAPPKQNA